MKTKPVAWALITKHSVAVVPDGSINHPSSRGYIPLYTHPVKDIIEKNKPEIEKTNAYIKSLEDEIAILRKASEK